jgi:phosphate butyryltransferase
MLKHINEILIKAQSLPKQRIVVVAAHDEYVLEAVNEAMKLGIVEPILIGNQKEIESMIHSAGYDRNSFHIIDSNDDELSSYKALELIRNQQADILMKGLIDTKILLKAVVNKELGIREARILSHVGLISFDDFDRILFVTDGAMLISPSVEEKMYIIENAVKLAKTLGIQTPKVGMVSAVEKVNPKMQSTVDADEVVKMNESGFIKGCIVGGPFAIDNLVSMDSVKHKGINHPVAGKADILVFPGIDSGNVFYKTSVFLGHAKSAGIVLGAKSPIVLTSRADSSLTKLYSIALAVVYHYELPNVSN